MARSDRERMKTLLVEAISTLCRNGLQYEQELSVEGLIGITLDKSDVFLISVKEHFTLAPEFSQKNSKVSNNTCVEDEVSPSPQKKGRRHEYEDTSDFVDSPESRESLPLEQIEDNKADHRKRKQQDQNGEPEISGNTTRKKKKTSSEDCILIDPDLSVKAEKREDGSCLVFDRDISSRQTLRKSHEDVQPSPRQMGTQQQHRDSRMAHPSGLDPEQMAVLFPIQIKQEGTMDSDSSVFTSPPDCEVIRMPQSMNRSLSETPVPIKMLGAHPSSSASTSDNPPFTSMPDFAGLPVDWGPHSTPPEYLSTTSPQASTSEGASQQIVAIPRDAVVREMSTETGTCYRCTSCNKAYPLRRSAGRHYMSIHMNIKFQCELCGQGFTQPGNLRKHRQKHLTLDPANSLLLTIWKHPLKYSQETLLPIFKNYQQE